MVQQHRRGLRTRRRSPSSSARNPSSVRCPAAPAHSRAARASELWDQIGTAIAERLGRRARRASTTSSPRRRWTRRPSRSPRPRRKSWPPSENTVDVDDAADDDEDDEDFEVDDVDLDDDTRTDDEDDEDDVLGVGRHRPDQDHHRRTETYFTLRCYLGRRRGLPRPGRHGSSSSPPSARWRGTSPTTTSTTSRRSSTYEDDPGRGRRRVARDRGHRRERLRAARPGRRPGRGPRRPSTRDQLDLAVELFTDAAGLRGRRLAPKRRSPPPRRWAGTSLHPQPRPDADGAEPAVRRRGRGLARHSSASSKPGCARLTRSQPTSAPVSRSARRSPV